MLDKQWDDAIRLAPASNTSARVFVESREDLFVEAGSGDHPEVRRTFWGGAGVDLEDRGFTFHSNVGPEDLQDLIAGRPPPDRRRKARLPSLDHEPALAAVVGSVVDAQKRLPAGVFHASWVQSCQEIRVGNADGVHDDRRRACRLRLEGRLRRGDRGSRATVERRVDTPEVPVSALVGELIERLEARLQAREPSTGPSAVVFAPSIGGIWIHEVIGHAAEADRVLRGRSWFGEQIDGWPGELEILDDPRRGRAAWRIDDEGTPARAVALVHRGRPRDLLHSCATASIREVEPTGHGRRSSYRERVVPRMGCTFIAAGSRHPDEILKNIQRGLYVRRMESATTDPTTGRATFRVTDADAIVDGRIDAPLDPHLLETHAPQGLAAIDGIGDDLAFDHCIGLCHRDGQPLSTSVGAPTICTRLMTVRL